MNPKLRPYVKMFWNDYIICNLYVINRHATKWSYREASIVQYGNKLVIVLDGKPNLIEISSPFLNEETLLFPTFTKELKHFWTVSFPF